ncbi:MAG: acetyl-CoA carboxylase carboxyltransferase subunit alpha [Bacteroidetes bacterium]|nr:acetyl-CoA carboxylase carboxyltransferase subunit alpha [Bacteroidota bacterium]
MNILDFEKPIYDVENKIEELISNNKNGIFDEAIKKLQLSRDEFRSRVFSELTRWQRVQMARHPDRPYTLDYIHKICDRFMELHGDRNFGDDKAMVGGVATLNGISVMIIGQQKGRDTKSRQYRNFGMANPEGYRKALRLMKMAEKFNMPIITLVDTPGAFPGLEAEERGQAEAIAKNLREMAMLRVPLITVIIGEGASGGAIGIGMGNEVYMMEYTWYSVISPESCSSILWKSWDHKEQAASALKLAPADLVELKVIDGIIKEPIGGAHRDHKAAADLLKEQLMESLNRLLKLSAEELIEQRIEKYSSMGQFEVR